VPQGWTSGKGRSPRTRSYFDYQLIEKTNPRLTPHPDTLTVDQPDDYQTDVFTDRAFNFVEDKGSAISPSG